MSSLQSRVLVAVIGVPVLAWVVLWAPLPVLAAAVCALAGIGGVELQRCVSGMKMNGLVAMSGLFPAFTVGCYFLAPQYVGVVLCAEAVILFVHAILGAGEVKFNQTMAALFGSIVIAYSFASFIRIALSGISRAYLLLPFILSFACDTFAYFAGCAFGKHKLAPKVSPKKTVEGSVGGILGNLACGLLFASVMDRWFGGSVGYGAMAVLALCCSIVAQVGDLSFSLIKREFGIKDYGHLFLEHGGVLDRFDSVLFVAPVVEIVLNFVH